MEITKNIEVPTGNILIGEGKNGLLECLSIGDYGKIKNIKADFLGLKREINGVPHGKLLPLTEKWVVTISTQYGCSMNCRFCDVPKVGKGENATFNDLKSQILESLKLHPEITYTNRLNVHFARMGEPTFNPDVLDCTKWLKGYIDPKYKVHPVVSTMMPRKNIWLKTFIHNWMRIKNQLYNGNAGLQFSINSTDERERKVMFCNNALSLSEIHKLMIGVFPVGRKITLNFALNNYTIDPKKLASLFNPLYYLCKITPMHRTDRAVRNKISTPEGYVNYEPYKEIEEKLKSEGFDVIVFVPSIEEDESKITCGNAILSERKKERSNEVEIIKFEKLGNKSTWEKVNYIYKKLNKLIRFYKEDSDECNQIKYVINELPDPRYINEKNAEKIIIDIIKEIGI